MTATHSHTNTVQSTKPRNAIRKISIWRDDRAGAATQRSSVLSAAIKPLVSRLTFNWPVNGNDADKYQRSVVRTAAERTALGCETHFERRLFRHGDRPFFVVVAISG